MDVDNESFNVSHYLDGLILKSKSKWLENVELLRILKLAKANSPTLASKLPVLKETILNPPSGTLCMYNRNLNKKYKKDNIEYVKRPGKSIKSDDDKYEHVREDVCKLQVNKEKVIYCKYTHGEANKTFHRRSYRLNNDGEELILVHYLDDGGLSSGSRNPSQNITPSTTTFSSPSASSRVRPNVLDNQSKSTSKNLESLLSNNNLDIMSSLGNKNFDSNDFDFFDTADGSSPTFSDVDFEDIFANDEILPSVSTISSSMHVNTSALINSNENMNNNSNDPFMIKEKNKTISILQQRIISLESDIEFLKERAIPEARNEVEIISFAPQGDTISGGSILLLVTSFPYACPRPKVKFGDIIVPASHVGLGSCALQCFVPPRVQSGIVPISICSEKGESVTIGNKLYFSYEPKSSEFLNASPSFLLPPSMNPPLNQTVMARKRSIDNISTSASHEDGDEDMAISRDERDVKVRVIEKESTNATSFDVFLNNDEEYMNIDKLNNEELSLKGEVVMENVILQLVELVKASTNSKKKASEELNELDSKGLSMLHYICIYNYPRLIPPLINNGAGVNVPSSSGMTSLHFAASRGNKDCILSLIAFGAKTTVRDSRGLFPSDHARINGFHEVGEWLLSREKDHNSSSLKLKSNEKLVEPSEIMDRQLFATAFSELSLHDKCALSLGIKHPNASSLESPLETDNITDLSPSISISQSDAEVEVASVISDAEFALNAAMSLMSISEVNALEEEAKVIQSNVRGWLLRKNYRMMKDATKTLQQWTRKHFGSNNISNKKLNMVESDLVIPNSLPLLQQKTINNKCNNNNNNDAAAVKIQSATRGMLARSQYNRMKQEAFAAMVIQKKFRTWRS